MPRPPARYWNESVSRACRILEALSAENRGLRLKEIAARAGIDSATAFRILKTLGHHGWVEMDAERAYRSRVRTAGTRRYKIGYAAQSSEFAFSRDVSLSLEQAARREDIELVAVNNRYSPARALANAGFLIRQGVDLVMEFQTDEEAAPALSAKYSSAGIRVIAIEIPHPGAVYFGANNYEAGRIGGRCLGRWARSHWGGQVEEILLLELPMAGPLPGARLAGTLQGIREVLPKLEDCRPVRINGNGQFARSLEAVRKHLRSTGPAHTLVGAINDPSAIGAVRAFQEAGRAGACAVVGQNASLEARSELRRRHTPLVGSVAYFPERYGEGLIRLAQDLLANRPVPPAVFTDHALITSKNVDHYYPNDRLLTADEIDSSMLTGGQ